MTLGAWSALSPAVLSVIHAHVLSTPDVEVGGFIVGTYGDESEPPKAVAAIEAYAARGDRTRLTFTHDAWEHVHRVLEDEYPDNSIVGWYHSHPQHGIFLSEHDRFVHRHFFPAPWQIAVVVDPLRRSEGLFVWARGEIELASERDLGGAEESLGGAGGTAFTRRSDFAPRAERPRLVVELDDPVARQPEPPVVVPELPVEPIYDEPGPWFTESQTELPPPPRPTERYPIAGHLLPVCAGLGAGLGLAIALQVLA